MDTKQIIMLRNTEHVIVISRPRVCGFKWFGTRPDGGEWKGLLGVSAELMSATIQIASTGVEK